MLSALYVLYSYFLKKSMPYLLFYHISEILFQRIAPGIIVILLRLSQELLQLFRYAGLKRDDRVYCIYNNDLEVHSYVENTRIGDAEVKQGHYRLQR